MWNPAKLSARKLSNAMDERNKNEIKKDILHIISKYFVSIVQKFQLLSKLKSNKKPI